MMKRWLGVFAALTLVGSSVACSSSSDPGAPAPTDTGKGDTKTDGAIDVPKPVDADSAKPDGDGAVPPDCDKTTGKKCTTSDDCDVTGNGIGHCTNALFSLGTLYPTPVCFGADTSAPGAQACDPGDGTTIKTCDCDTGICVGFSSGGADCFPGCTFDDTGAAPVGCEGKNLCEVYGWDPTKKTGVGICFGGCHVDADCTGGDKCQVESGLCVKTKVTYAKAVGDPCTKADADAKPAACNCFYTTKDGKGWCNQVCKFGDTSWTCPTGWTCDTGLPTKDAKTGDPLFSKSPSGIEGSCQKNCTADADCTALNGYCELSAGMTQKTCHLGTRP